MKSRTVKVDYLARVEGEGSLHVKISGEKVSDVRFKIFEPPRFFESFLRGRDFTEAPDITARICGICPIAYQMSSCHAMERACGAVVDGQLRELRRLIYCGEWIESHALHVFMLHAPDFLGFQDAIQMASEYGEIVQRGLRIKKAGNDLVTVVGGREIHPVNVKVGGFYRAPSRQELSPLIEPLAWARDAAVETVKLVAGFHFPDFERDYEFVSLRHPSEYPFNEGRLVSNRGLDIPIEAYEAHFTEEHVEHSNALQSIHRDVGPYFVGPLARFNLNFDRLSPIARKAAEDVGLAPICTNPFKSIIVRAVELVYACDEALRIIANYAPPAESSVRVTPREGIGHGCTEAPRGICYHRYKIDDAGVIRDAKIVPPTSQNQKTIENDLREYVGRHLEIPHDDLTWQCEQAVRNYDPCISCATHSLKLTFERE